MPPLAYHDRAVQADHGAWSVSGIIAMSSSTRMSALAYMTGNFAKQPLPWTMAISWRNFGMRT
jgi:hypothetical protein